MVARTAIRIRTVSEETVNLHHTNLKNHVGQAKKRQNDNTVKHPARGAGRRIRHRPSAEFRASAPRRTARTHPAVAELPRRQVPQYGSRSDDDGRQEPFARHTGISLPQTGGTATRRCGAGDPHRPAGARSQEQPAGLVRALVLPDSGRRAPDARRSGFPQRGAALAAQPSVQRHRHLPPRRDARHRLPHRHARPLGSSRLPHGPRAERAHRPGHLSAGRGRALRVLGLRPGEDRRAGLARTTDARRRIHRPLSPLAPLLRPRAVVQSDVVGIVPAANASAENLHGRRRRIRTPFRRDRRRVSGHRPRRPRKRPVRRSVEIHPHDARPTGQSRKRAGCKADHDRPPFEIRPRQTPLGRAAGDRGGIGRGLRAAPPAARNRRGGSAGNSAAGACAGRRSDGIIAHRTESGFNAAIPVPAGSFRRKPAIRTETSRTEATYGEATRPAPKHLRRSDLCRNICGGSEAPTSGHGNPHPTPAEKRPLPRILRT